MKVIVTGSTGLVGQALIRSLMSEGHSVTRLVRGGAQTFRAPNSVAVNWDPERGQLDAGELEGHDAAVHLAGEPVAEGRWTDEKKRRILESRVKSTRLLAETLAGLKDKPKVLVSASATGFYGNRGAEVLVEESASGEDFLSEVCREWEKATLAGEPGGHPRRAHAHRHRAERRGRRAREDADAVQARRRRASVGSGEQYMSWITLDDLVGVIRHAIENEARARPGQRRRAAGGDERGVHEGAGARARAPDRPACAGVRRAPRLRRDGRRGAARGRARRAGAIEGDRLRASSTRRSKRRCGTCSKNERAGNSPPASRRPRCDT